MKSPFNCTRQSKAATLRSESIDKEGDLNELIKEEPPNQWDHIFRYNWIKVTNSDFNRRRVKSEAQNNNRQIEKKRMFITGLLCYYLATSYRRGWLVGASHSACMFARHYDLARETGRWCGKVVLLSYFAKKNHRSSPRGHTSASVEFGEGRRWGNLWMKFK